ncbi:MAG: hypothetical protein JNM72_21230 [Deltaproteobacteria bacterium]|jgi:hypothetical protein|nr:hypothetical protein [Deltaproteobacteria bacterium]
MLRRALPLLLALPAAGCSRLLTIEVEGQSSATIEGGTILEQLVGDLGFSSFLSMDITEEEELKNQGVEPGDLVRVELTALTLEVVEGDPDLRFIESLLVSAEAPELPTIAVAGADDFPEGEALVALDVMGVDLVDYATSAKMTLRTEAEARRPDQTSRLVARYTLEVEATVRGAAKQAKGD